MGGVRVDSFDLLVRFFLSKIVLRIRGGFFYGNLFSFSLFIKIFGVGEFGWGEEAVGIFWGIGGIYLLKVVWEGSFGFDKSDFSTVFRL